MIEEIDNEEWRDVDGFPGYQVSSLGRVKSLDRYVAGRTGTPKFTAGCILSQYKRTYHSVTLCRDGKKLTSMVHRIVASAFIPNPQNKRCVNHKNGVKADNRVENLEWATYSENERHSFSHLGKKGRRGKDHKSSKLWGCYKDGVLISKAYSVREASLATGLSLNVVKASIFYRKLTRNGLLFKNIDQ